MSARSNDVSFGLQPLSSAQIDLREDGAAIVFGFGSDPQLLWKPDDGALFRRVGSIRVEAELELLDGALAAPRIYANWGDGFVESSASTLRSAGGGRYTGSLTAQGRACLGIRFDPSTRPCTCVLRAFRVTPIGRLETPAGVMDHLVDLTHLMLGPRAAAAMRVARKMRIGVRRVRDRIRRLGRTGNIWREAYVTALLVSQNLRSEHFAAPPAGEMNLRPDSPKILAFYLPQFHPIPENDQWWGAGFTEWANVSKAPPQFVGHYQPRLPGELGYYDLRLTSILRRQIELAGLAGIHGFCIHYYWFGGKRLLERPLDTLLENPDLQMPFALCWANENWTRRWDGAESDVLIAQDHSPEDDIAVFTDMARYMADARYIRIDEKPVLVVYRPDILPDAAATARRWRDQARKLGLGEIHLLCTTAFGFSDYAEIGYDGLVQFPPHASSTDEITNRVIVLNEGFSGKVFDYSKVASNAMAELVTLTDPAVYPGSMPGWDNSARKPGRGHVFQGSTPRLFSRWLGNDLSHMQRSAPAGRRFVFINAWNEWGEGAYLEPDRWFGYAYLHAVRAALTPYVVRLDPADPRLGGPATRKGPAVVLLHIFYPELIDWFSTRLAVDAPGLDRIITFPITWSSDQLDDLRRAFPDACLIPVENQGRDVAPFLIALEVARDTGHEVFVKLHSKRSPHRAGGDDWRSELYGGLFSRSVEATLDLFKRDAQLGMIASKSSRMFLSDPDVMENNRATVGRLARLLGLSSNPSTPFVAGTMFWGRVSAFSVLMACGKDELGFDSEMGQVDGTTAHGLERLMCAMCSAAGYHPLFDGADDPA